jgi:hypothetical protein
MHNSSIVENGTLAKKLAKQIVVVGKDRSGTFQNLFVDSMFRYAAKKNIL